MYRGIPKIFIYCGFIKPKFFCNFRCRAYLLHFKINIIQNFQNFLKDVFIARIGQQKEEDDIGGTEYLLF